MVLFGKNLPSRIVSRAPIVVMLGAHSISLCRQICDFVVPDSISVG
jgi:hypothetical protein